MRHREIKQEMCIKDEMYFHKKGQGMTVARLEIKYKGTTYIAYGESKLHPKDKWDKKMGRKVARQHAIFDFCEGTEYEDPHSSVGSPEGIYAYELPFNVREPTVVPGITRAREPDPLDWSQRLKVAIVPGASYQILCLKEVLDENYS